MKLSGKTLLLGLSMALLQIASVLSPASGQSIKDGINAEELQKYELARSIYSKVLAKEPNNSEAMYHMGIIAYKNYQYDSAKYFFDKGIAANGNDGLNYVGLGLLNLHDKNKDAAKQNFDKALAVTNNQNAYVMQQIVDAMWIEQETKFADYTLALAKKAVDIDKKNERFAISLGDADRLTMESSQGIAVYKKIRNDNPKYLLATLRIGELYANVSNYSAAEEEYNNILKADPNYPPVYPDLGELYYHQGKLDKAQDAYKKFLSMVGNSCSEKLRYASFLYLLKDYKNAVDQLNAVVKCIPNNTMAWRLKAYSEYESGDYTTGLQSIQKLMTVAKNDKVIGKDYAYYGRLLRKAGQDSLAIINLKKGMEEDTSSTDLYDALAESYAKMKNYNEAANIIEKKLVKTQNNISAIDYFTLGTYYYAAGNYVKADTAFGYVNKYYPTYSIGYLYRARINLELDKDMKIGKFRQYYQKFIDLAQPDAAKYKNEISEAYKYLGIYAYNHEDMVKAKEYFEKAKELTPDDQDILKFLKYIDNKNKKKK
jgi:tetratricopeptide (TPR) repeat protein